MVSTRQVFAPKGHVEIERGCLPAALYNSPQVDRLSRGIQFAQSIESKMPPLRNCRSRPSAMKEA